MEASIFRTLHLISHERTFLMPLFTFEEKTKKFFEMLENIIQRLKCVTIHLQKEAFFLLEKKITSVFPFAITLSQYHLFYQS